MNGTGEWVEVLDGERAFVKRGWGFPCSSLTKLVLELEEIMVRSCAISEFHPFVQ